MRRRLLTVGKRVADLLRSLEVLLLLITRIGVEGRHWLLLLLSLLLLLKERLLPSVHLLHLLWRELLLLSRLHLRRRHLTGRGRASGCAVRRPLSHTLLH